MKITFLLLVVILPMACSSSADSTVSVNATGGAYGLTAVATGGASSLSTELSNHETGGSASTGGVRVTGGASAAATGGGVPTGGSASGGAIGATGGHAATGGAANDLTTFACPSSGTPVMVIPANDWEPITGPQLLRCPQTQVCYGCTGKDDAGVSVFLYYGCEGRKAFYAANLSNCTIFVFGNAS